MPYTINSLLHTVILDHLLKHHPWAKHPVLCHFPNTKKIHSIKLPALPHHGLALPLPMDQYTGVYTHCVFGNVTIREGTGIITPLVLVYGQMHFPLLPKQFDDETKELEYSSHKFMYIPVNSTIQWLVYKFDVTFLVSKKGPVAVELPILEPWLEDQSTVLCKVGSDYYNCTDIQCSRATKLLNVCLFLELFLFFTIVTLQ